MKETNVFFGLLLFCNQNNHLEEFKLNLKQLGWNQHFEEAFKQCDVLLTPTTPVLAEAYNTEMDAFAKYELDFTTVTANLAGLPAITVPCGMVDGMPVGMQLIGKVLDEATILKAAYTFEQATDFHKAMAPLGGNK